MKHLLTDTAALLRILELVHNGLVDNTVMTKRYKLSGAWAFSVLTLTRDLYYRHPDLFVKQSVVDRYIDDLACTFGISRSQLNVVRSHLAVSYTGSDCQLQAAAAKGLVAGGFGIIREDGHRIDGMKDREVGRNQSTICFEAQSCTGNTCSQDWRE